MKTKETLDGRSIPMETRLETILEKLQGLQPGEGIELIAPHAPEKLLRKLLEDFPLRYDFAPLQNGPEQWRVHIHVREHPFERTVFAYLAWDHDRLDALLAQARHDVENGQWEDAHARIAEFRDGLFRHIDIEEDILFPAFEDVTGIREQGPTSVMRHEHVSIKESVDGMVQAVADQSQDDFERHHANLLGVLVEHNMKEENILYPSTDRAVDDVKRSNLVEDLLLG